MPLNSAIPGAPTVVDDIVRGLRKVVLNRWRELLILLGLYLVTDHFGLVGLVAVLVAVSPLLIWSKSRAWIFKNFQDRSFRRKIHAALERTLDSVPQIVKIANKSQTLEVTLRLVPGITADDVRRVAEHIAVELEMGSVRVTRARHNAALVILSLVKGAPLSGKILYWQSEASRATTLWDPILIGIDETGDLIAVRLPDNNLIAGGEPGAGKSVFLARMLAEIVRDAGSTLYIFDGKPPELSIWASLAAGHVGTDIDAAIGQIDLIRDLMDARYQRLAELGLKKVTPQSGMGFVVTVIDEFPYYLASGKQGKVFAEKVRDLVARGRAAGMVVILTAQKPTADTVPTSIRDLISLRVAFRCSSREASEVILGSGWSSQGYSASSIPLSDRGIGYLLGEVGIPQLFRAYYLDETQETAVIASAHTMRPSLDNGGDLDANYAT
ncbi:MAG: FtsK/SpoIIIE domain-containing protein [Ferrimicrobium sp.]